MPVHPIPLTEVTASSLSKFMCLEITCSESFHVMQEYREKKINKTEMMQGHSTATILTNRSKNQTVIRPYAKATSPKAPSLAKGTRWMHRTTLTLEKNPHKDLMESSMDIVSRKKKG